MSLKKKVDNSSKYNYGGSLTLQFKGINPSIVNAIRRTVIIDIPAWSINKFEVEINTSPLIDEYITKRISLVPMKNDTFRDGDVPPTFILDVKATEEGILKVFSHDIKPDYFRPNIIVAKLKGKLPDSFESLKIKMSAERHSHRHHASFSSVTAVEYELSDNEKECKMVINGNGTYKVETLLDKALDVIVERLKGVESIMEITDLPDGMKKIKIESPDNILGELIQTHIIEFYKDRVTFISANRPHPLENHIIIEIKVAEKVSETVQEIMSKTLAELVKIFEKFYK